MIERAILLCAGAATRLRPLTDDRPKCLLDVGGETILARAVRLLLAAGVRELVIATGYRENDVRAALAGCPAEVIFCHNAAFAHTQNAVSLHHCARAARGRSFLKLDGDVLFGRAVLERLLADDAPLSVAIERRDDLGEEEMKVVTDGDHVRAFGKKLDPRRCAGESIGIEKLDTAAGAALFGALERAVVAGRTDLYYEDVYGELIGAGMSAHAVDVSDLPWIEVDTADDLARAREWAEEGRLDLRKA
ncbi:MAG TPA: phosphocholine cytidylyltransferase family protein [Polyangiaceae bacterium]|nr:phosphocholine cytidylyltransferase family protein [Polyangiaceae bacterium]